MPPVGFDLVGPYTASLISVVFATDDESASYGGVECLPEPSSSTIVGLVTVLLLRANRGVRRRRPLTN